MYSSVSQIAAIVLYQTEVFSGILKDNLNLETGGLRPGLRRAHVDLLMALLDPRESI